MTNDELIEIALDLAEFLKVFINMCPRSTTVIFAHDIQMGDLIWIKEEEKDKQLVLFQAIKTDNERCIVVLDPKLSKVRTVSCFTVMGRFEPVRRNIFSRTRHDIRSLKRMWDDCKEVFLEQNVTIDEFLKSVKPR